MTCVIVNDASCLIDLRKGGLLEALCRLPYRLVIPLPIRASAALSANDCFCLVTALANRGILLTGDAQLRNVATQKGLRVHGVLWVIDELAAADACPTSQLIDALKRWQGDDTVFLPRQEIAKRLGSLLAPRRSTQTHPE